MRCGEDTYVGAEHAPVSNRDETAVENGKVEVCVEAGTERDVAAVVNVERWFDENVVVGYVTR